jgi:hypothetical protein
LKDKAPAITFKKLLFLLFKTNIVLAIDSVNEEDRYEINENKKIN